ncbi:hypothetical protein Poli38472_012655 [Pythium oligandrum]|uniref:NmrA-like domain-containing protein n=1 Tax=Pythium oligandrum TaxID=41045 RepID=A0A8K1CDK5_PYTOL|nr:hypothetical protein Poli38472_012655 [Pythium oligandrum]|eukprot:TMW61464.1 hypothetical protein Poli38472_012655 [Pythium oligandrum]
MNTPSLTSGRILVTGASGELGKLTLHHLLHTIKVNPKQIVAGTRSPHKLQIFADVGVQTCFVDFSDLSSVTVAAQGIERALVISSRDFDQGESHKAVIRTLMDTGVQHIVYTSAQAVSVSNSMIAGGHRATEICLEESKIPGYTILRNGMYFENCFAALKNASKSGNWLTCAKDGKLSCIARDDAARAAAYALALDTKGRHTLEITGPEALSVDEIVSQISNVIGKPLQVLQVSELVLATAIAETLNAPAVIGQLCASLDKTTAEGYGDFVSDDYKKLTGVEPKKHADWAMANRLVLADL